MSATATARIGAGTGSPVGGRTATTRAGSGAASRPGFRCTECGWQSVKWVGRCGECQAWATVEEVAGGRTRGTTAARPSAPPPRIEEVDLGQAQALPTGVGEFDRVLGGGLVAGGVVLVAGEPGIGKSTLLLDVAARAARAGRSVLYVSGEESAAQVRLRAERIGALAPGLYLAAETDLGTILGQLDAVTPHLVVVDSVQTVASAQVDGSAGGVSQIREVAAALTQVAKTRGVGVLLVGHVTKDGSIAGPRLLEHLVDVVVAFEGERHSRLRLVRAVKNRFGPTDEVGCFELAEAGLTGLPDPSGLFLSSRDATVPGTCVTVTLEGRRPLVAEVQALVTPAAAQGPRRVSHGLDGSRIAMLLAVLQQRAGGNALARSDAYVATVGGVRITEPAADLSVALAVASAVQDVPFPADGVAFGEVGLAGDVRSVAGMPRRLAEAARLGFRRAWVPPGALDAGPAPDGIRVIEVPHLWAAVGRALSG
jgi:DNA repair protein RadA/Sms